MQTSIQFFKEIGLDDVIESMRASPKAVVKTTRRILAVEARLGRPPRASV